jgi:hypothetical protein
MNGVLDTSKRPSRKAARSPRGRTLNIKDFPELLMRRSKATAARQGKTIREWFICIAERAAAE